MVHTELARFNPSFHQPFTSDVANCKHSPSRKTENTASGSPPTYTQQLMTACVLSQLSGLDTDDSCHQVIDPRKRNMQYIEQVQLHLFTLSSVACTLFLKGVVYIIYKKTLILQLWPMTQSCFQTQKRALFTATGHNSSHCQWECLFLLPSILCLSMGLGLAQSEKLFLCRFKGWACPHVIRREDACF